MFHNETQPEDQIERSVPLPTQPALPDAEVQRKRMLIALGILLLALVAVVLRDWDFWFPPEGEVHEAVFRARSKSSVPATVSTPAAAAKDKKPAKTSTPAASSEAPPFSATTERTTLPPLQVEVVAGNRHMNVPAKSSAIHLDVDSGSTSSAAPAASASVDRTVADANHMALSRPAAQNVTVSVPPDYPLLARQMKVQGAVSLQALISRDGSIQELQILSGPGILATAAREAVKQWHFKPYLQNGQPVETQARITVNFTISTN